MDVNSVRFFPRWSPDDPNQVIGFIKLLHEVDRVLGRGLRWVEVGGYLGESATLVCGFSPLRMDIIEASQLHAENLRKRFSERWSVNVVHAKSVEAAATYAEQSVDVVYIDADHEYESVSADIDAWLPKVRSGGFIGGHDYHDGFLGVRRAVDERMTLWATFCDSSWIARVQ